MNNVVFRKLLKSLLLIAALACHAIYAEEQTDANANDSQAPTETQQTDSQQPPTERSPDQKAAKQQKDKNRDGEIFRPSEEISEDFAVSFPVDI